MTVPIYHKALSKCHSGLSPFIPRITLAVAWYRADEDFPPDATILYPDNTLSYLPLEDVIVLAECLVARLGGKPW